MKKLLAALAFPVLLAACKNNTPPTTATNDQGNKQLAAMLDSYWQERMQLFPVEATSNGDNRYNDKLTITIAESFRDSLGRFYKKYLDEVSKVDSTTLDKNDLEPCVR